MGAGPGRREARQLGWASLAQRFSRLDAILRQLMFGLRVQHRAAKRHRLQDLESTTQPYSRQMVFLLRLCGGGGGVVVTISSSSHLTGSLLPRICMTSACCHLENLSSLRKNQHLSFILFAPVSAEDLPSQGEKRAKGKSISWTWPGGDSLCHPLGEARVSWTCWSNLEDVWTGLALRGRLGQRRPSPLEHEFVRQ